MKTNETRDDIGSAGMVAGFKQACLSSCDKILARIKQAKAAIFSESQANLHPQERLLRLALNEAEAIAWQTGYPHLVFPMLAVERVQAIANWETRQRLIRQPNPILARAT